MYTVKNVLSPGHGNWNFKNMKLGLEVFLNFFPCEYKLTKGSGELKMLDTGTH